MPVGTPKFLLEPGAHCLIIDNGSSSNEYLGEHPTYNYQLEEFHHHVINTIG